MTVRYLEISPRQTGKTYRLIQDATKRFYLEKKKIVVVTPIDKRYFRDIMPFAFLVVKTEEAAVRELAARGVEEDDPELAWYYDEFDMLKGHITLKADAYYTTTPRFIRNEHHLLKHKGGERVDFLLTAIESNAGVYTSAFHRALSYERVLHVAKDYGPEFADVELGGRFFDLKVEVPTQDLKVN